MSAKLESSVTNSDHNYKNFYSLLHGLNEELGRHRGREDGMFFVWG